jgi:Alpha-L-rhamnosidase N-terminal domain./Bacterial alpha-L-rhamnosidase.
VFHTIKIVKTRCEYKYNPIGIDVKLPRFNWQIESDGKGIMQTAYRIQIIDEDAGFVNTSWDSGKVESDQSIHVNYAGKALKPRTRYHYHIKIWDNKENESDWSEAAYWETGLLSENNWVAKWITPYISPDDTEKEKCPYLRREFKAEGKIKSARIYATALGLYELHINGSKADDTLFTPGWTSYGKRLQYQTYDVTSLLKEGTNAIGAILGKGWYMGNLAWNENNGVFGNTYGLLMQLHITYNNGKEEVIISDNSWKSATGPILMSEIYHGETYDARLENTGWDMAGFADGKWFETCLLEYKGGALVSQENVPVRAIQEIAPKEISTTPKGEIVMDFGQNLVGRVCFNVQGTTGTEIILQHAEVLDKDGNFYTENLRSAKQTIRYILKGSGIETFEPTFTFQGFRYLKIDGYPGDIKLESFKAKVMHSDMEVTGSFNCSNELVNQLQHNILWGQKGNFLDLPTDCPQRDERLGWTGDAQMFIRTACFNMNVAPFFTKWLRDLFAEQTPDRGVPFVIPDVLSGKGETSSAWGDAATIGPWTIYTCYGDKRILEEQYESMKQWVEYIANQGTDRYLWNTGFHFGDWLGLDSKPDSYVGATPTDFIATAFYAYSTELLAKAAAVLGKTEDESKYTSLHANIVQSFRNEFVTSNGRLVSPTQTGHVLALMFNLVEEKHIKRTIETLVKYLEESKYHLTTGFVGTPYLCHVLSRYGYNEIAYKLLLQTDCPSWLYQITKGATTIWEHWDGIKEDGSFWSRDMNSFNHYAYGSIGDWMYRVVAGIDAATPGYKHVLVRPKPEEGLAFAEAAYDSMYGIIKSGWKKDGDMLKIGICIPANTTAEVVLPKARLDKVTESGRALSAIKEISGLVQLDEGVKLMLGSGCYDFEYMI